MSFMLFVGAHFDIYIADYHGYKPGSQDSSIFTPPTICKDAAEQPAEGLRSFPERLKAITPAVHYGMFHTTFGNITAYITQVK